MEVFFNWLKEKNHRTDQFQAIAERINTARINCTSEKIFALFSEDEFDVLYDLFKELSSSMEISIFRFWQSYIEMVFLLFACVRSAQEGRWNLHLEITSIEMLVTSLKFALMDCYAHGILVKMCYVMVKKCIFGMKLTEFVRDIKKNVFMNRLLINSGCHSDEKAVLPKV